MRFQDFAKSGHLPTLFSSFLYFDASFMIWVLLGALGTFVASDFQLTPGQKGLLVAVPTLAGSGFRIILGWAETKFGGKRTALAGIVVSMIPLLWGWLSAGQVWELYAVGILLGVAGASFAVALPMASRWFPPQYQGLVMGIAGAGNSGTLLATLFGPRLAQSFGWHAVFGFAVIPMIVTFFVVLALAKEASRPGGAGLDKGMYRAALRRRDTWALCALYSLTFGGFVGFSNYLGIFFHDQYGVSKVAAGELQTLVVAAGSFLRPVGGYIADRIGGTRFLIGLFAAGTILCFVASQFLPLAFEVAVFFFLMGCLGMGNGAVFQVVPVRMKELVGVATGMIGAAGGVGGFLLPSILGGLKGVTGTYATGLTVFVLALAVGAGMAAILRVRWRKWGHSLQLQI
ncbi:nitrate/nitrite transporter [Kyrpidia tusciae]|uniref:Major facilitator superfamily MFS_1 n=1 Tax=Kyrpidia tusciae (strain DSM 2912 / NBRC 15312 / T2) TaxID=562970 RepID=D5WXH3_KYRT2|nr:nitrate/nitrite transporter [Kyrpidia tusciae]ADG05894.1 major facilitator superfamily MFS_1 [Kyrpidia tusciae DSM 2912]